MRKILGGEIIKSKHSHNFIDMSGKTYGRLFVFSYNGTKNRKSQWLCRCICGNEVVVDGYRLRTGKTKSCGCLSKECSKIRATKHGLSGSKLYFLHNSMIQRCYNKNSTEYKNYGGRGIRVCDEWKGRVGFLNFYEWAIFNGYSEKLTLDRIDVNGNYEPNNCRWATQKEQMNNTRFNFLVEFNGEIHTLKEWSEKVEIPYKTLHKRLKSGWEVNRAFCTPKMKNQYV